MKAFKLIPLLIASTFITAPLIGYSADQEPGTMQRAGEFVDDVVLATTVKTTIVGDMGLKGFNVKVIVNQGDVQLSGYVDNQQDADRAAEIATGVKGVHTVHNSLLIKSK